MNWHIGQEIVCIKTHSQGVVKRGKIYTIQGLQQSSCECHYIDIDVGIKGNGSNTVRCGDCKGITRVVGNIHWLHEELFAPLEYDEQAIEELLEQPIYVEK